MITDPGARWIVPALALLAQACSEATLPAAEEWRREQTLLDAPSGLAQARLAMVSVGAGVQGERPALRMALPVTLEWEVPNPQGVERRLDLALAVISEEAAGVEVQLTLDHGFRTAQLVRHADGWREQSLELGACRRVQLQARSADESPAELALAGLELYTRGAARARSAPERPNIVMVVIDTLRADRLGAYGHDAGASPNLDALAREGTLFEHAWAPCSWTLPSTVTLLTGLEPPEQPLFQHGFVWLEGATETLAEELRADGCVTGGFSCNSLVNRDENNVAQGFDSFSVRHGARYESLVDEVHTWLAERGDERFFLYLHLFEPHRPLEPDADLLERMGGAPIPPARMRAAALQQQRAERGLAHDDELLGEYFAERFRHYDAEIASVDRQLGRLFEHLEVLGLADRTVIAVTSDHGEEFREHGLSGHAKQLYRESLHVPLILRGPGVPVGSRRAGSVTLDMLPRALLRLAGRGRLEEPAPGDLFGPPDEAPLFFSTQLGRWFGEGGGELQGPAPLYAVQLGQEKLFWFGLDEDDPGRGERAWVDLEADPGERALQPGGPARLGAALREWLALCTDRLDGSSNAAAARGVMEALGYAGD